MCMCFFWGGGGQTWEESGKGEVVAVRSKATSNAESEKEQPLSELLMGVCLYVAGQVAGKTPTVLFLGAYQVSMSQPDWLRQRLNLPQISLAVVTVEKMTLTQWELGPAQWRAFTFEFIRGPWEGSMGSAPTLSPSLEAAVFHTMGYST